MTLAKRHFALPLALALCAMFAAGVPEARAQSLSVPGLTDTAPPRIDFGPCTNVPHSPSNCVRVLACVGDDGVWFDGQARGWDTGEVVGQLSTGEPCAGTWSSRGPMGTGWSKLSCSGSMSAQVIYHTLHNETGTAQGTGIDNLGRRIQVWSGVAVLEYLESTTGKVATLPCGTSDKPADIPIS